MKTKTPWGDLKGQLHMAEALLYKMSPKEYCWLVRSTDEPGFEMSWEDYDREESLRHCFSED